MKVNLNLLFFLVGYCSQLYQKHEKLSTGITEICLLFLVKNKLFLRASRSELQDLLFQSHVDYYVKDQKFRSELVG